MSDKIYIPSSKGEIDISEYKDLEANVNSHSEQLADKANQTQVDTLQSQIESFQVVQTAGSNDSTILEVQAIRTDNFGNAHITANDRLSGIEQDLSNGSHTIKVPWTIGYIDGTTGIFHGNTSDPNLTNLNILTLKKDTTIQNKHTGYIRVYKYDANGNWLGQLTSVTPNSTYTLDADSNVKMTLEYGTATSDTTLGNSLVVITEPTKFTVIKNANTIQSDLYNSSLVLSPVWESGYVDGSNGSEHTNNISAKTIDIIFMPKGSTIEVANTSAVVAILKYVNGTWNSAINTWWTLAKGKYVFSEDTYIRLNYSLSGNPVITDLTQPNRDVIITKYTLLNRLQSVESTQGEIYNDNSLIKPTWKLGYIDGSDGSDHVNSVSAKTMDIIFLPKGSTIEITDSTVILAIMKYVNGAWNAAITTSWTMAKGKYVFSSDMYVRFNYSYSGSPTITDLTLPNSYVTIKKCTLLNRIENIEGGYWVGKKIVWFGTSIPAGTVTVNGKTFSYPSLIGEMLGATVYDEAVGSSPARAGSHADITPDDPMGYKGIASYDVLLRSLSLSSSEKQAIFDNWATWRTKLQGNPPASISSADQTTYKNYSWDIKLAKYLTGGSVGQVDLYVFDHGHNDSINYNWNDSSEMGIIPADYRNRTYFIGAMNFLVDKILSNNPKAKILFIGHYENDRKAGISQSQQILADYWDYPFIKTWERMGWSQKQVTSGGVTKTITQWWLPDDLHPHSDTTGAATTKYANVLYPLIRDIR